MTIKTQINKVKPYVNKLQSDIYRKFRPQFTYLLSHPLSNPKYIPNEDEQTYIDRLSLFAKSPNYDVLYLLGYTGAGKTTLLKHFFKYTNAPKIWDGNTLIIPTGWDDKGNKSNVQDELLRALYSSLKPLHCSFEEIYSSEYMDIWNYFNDKNIPLALLDPDEILANRGNIQQAVLQKTYRDYKTDFAVGLLLYTLTTHHPKINRIIFIADDLETLPEKDIVELYIYTFEILEKIREIDDKIIVNPLFSLRPHSYRYLRGNSDNSYINAYDTRLQNDNNILVKDSLPPIKILFLDRFEEAKSNTPVPGNLDSWENAKQALKKIIDDLDTRVLKMIQDLCHLNIRSISQWFELILLNRVWCQTFSLDFEHPQITPNAYRFDIVNVLRTMACGENPVYTGGKLNWYISDSLLQESPIFDGSDVFIPNLLINIDDHTCDVLIMIIIYYIANWKFFHTDAREDGNYIRVITLKKELVECFGESYLNVTENRINACIEYIFKNRIVRKSFSTKDHENTRNILGDDDFLYITKKGERLLSMFETDSVLLEIYREDILRDYEVGTNKSSFELSADDKLDVLYADLIQLCKEIFYSEDNYATYIYSFDKEKYSLQPLPIATSIIQGVITSIKKSNSLLDKDKTDLLNTADVLLSKIETRKRELSTTEKK